MSKSKFRDRLAWRMSTFVFNHVATKEYRDKVTVVIMAGLTWLSHDSDKTVDK